ncbi:MAG: hypothetical protein WCJ64_02155 [Rhodospirillaceae bacterium]
MRAEIEPIAAQVFRVLADDRAEDIRKLRAENEQLKVQLAELERGECPECARRKETTTRLYAEISGLEERITKGDRRQDERIERLELERDEWQQRCADYAESRSADDDFFLERYHAYRERVRNDIEHLEQWRLLEAEVEMLRRARGTGRGRGRVAGWTPFQAGQVREMQAAGRSLRQIAKEVGISLSQVTTILSRPADQPHPETEKHERFVRRIQQIEQFIKGAKIAEVEADRRARRAAKQAKRKAA